MEKYNTSEQGASINVQVRQKREVLILTLKVVEHQDLSCQVLVLLNDLQM
jgi:hypothetical protein